MMTTSGKYPVNIVASSNEAAVPSHTGRGFDGSKREPKVDHCRDRDRHDSNELQCRGDLGVELHPDGSGQQNQNEKSQWTQQVRRQKSQEEPGVGVPGTAGEGQHSEKGSAECGDHQRYAMRIARVGDQPDEGREGSGENYAQQQDYACREARKGLGVTRVVARHTDADESHRGRRETECTDRAADQRDGQRENIDTEFGRTHPPGKQHLGKQGHSGATDTAQENEG